MGENRIQIRHGAAAPTSGDLLEHEMGYSRSDKTLYINDSGSIISVAGGAPIDITSSLSIEATSAMGSQPSIISAFYRNGYVTMQVRNASSGAIAPNGEMSGFITYPSEYAPIMTVTGIGYNRQHAIVGRVNPSGSFYLRNCSETSISDAATINTFFTYPCAGPTVVVPGE